ncbi:hypothetical protein J3Q64DRAFT_1724853 [Phycomyces blakesleeanus]|uniref:Uncharacterized protein n=1 Tax=Phycomyces blakesleeanus TaxID=4837 RepID=A0ABR3B745_PHYBL
MEQKLKSPRRPSSQGRSSLANNPESSTQALRSPLSVQVASESIGSIPASSRYSLRHQRRKFYSNNSKNNNTTTTKNNSKNTNNNNNLNSSNNNNNINQQDNNNIYPESPRLFFSIFPFSVFFPPFPNTVNGSHRSVSRSIQEDSLCITIQKDH